MNGTRKCLLIFVSIISCSPLLFSAPTTRYIAQSAGTFNAGTACNGQTAISAATFNSTKNSPGDVDYVCGTISAPAGGNVLTVNGSGTSGNPVTLIFDTGASLSAPYCNWAGNSSACLVISTPSTPQSYIVVDGGTPCGYTITGGAEPACNGTIVNTGSGTGMAENTSTGAIEAENCNGCEIKNLGIYNLYVQSGGNTNADPQDERCVDFSGSNNLIHDNRFHDVGWCIFYAGQNGDSGNQVYQNDVYNTPHPMFVGGNTGTETNLYTYANHFHDYANWNTAACVYHVEGIHTSGPSNAPFPVLNGFYVYDNYFGPNEGTCLYNQVFFSVDVGSSPVTGLANQSYVFNNIIELSQGGQGGIDIGAGNGNAVYNNTLIYDTPISSTIGISWSNITEHSGYRLTYKNNVVQGFYTVVQDDNTGSEGSSITADYNVYSSCASGHNSCLQAFFPGGTSNWSSYTGNGLGQETHSINTGLWSGAYCCSGSLGLTSNFTPSSVSAVIGAGTNLHSTCSGQPVPGLGALCSDYAGNVRPSSGSWDAGAYQSGSSQQPPAPPTGLAAAVQ